jgi:hypothetical protein
VSGEGQAIASGWSPRGPCIQSVLCKCSFLALPSSGYHVPFLVSPTNCRDSSPLWAVGRLCVWPALAAPQTNLPGSVRFGVGGAVGQLRPCPA